MTQPSSSQEEQQPAAAAASHLQTHAPVSAFLPGGQFAMPLSAFVPAATTAAPWCSVQYYELKTKVGESYHASGPEFTIDGYTCPLAPNRFSVGALSNVNRCREVESVRRLIGRGVHIQRNADTGEVFLTNLSNSPVFLQAPCINYDSNPGVVVRLDVGSDKLLVFSMHSFLEKVQQLRGRWPPREALNRAQALCSIRLSFVKGWGHNYQLQCIMSTPCHCEVIFNEAYRELDGDLTNPALADMPSSMS